MSASSTKSLLRDARSIGRARGFGLALATVLAAGALAGAHDAEASNSRVDVFLGNGKGATVASDADRLISVTESRGALPVIVRMRTEFAAEGDLSLFGAANQRAAYASLTRRILSRVPAGQNVKTYESVPLVAMTLDADGIEALLSDPNVESITEDVPVPPSLNQSIPIIRANKVWNKKKKNGKGYTVAVLDTGYSPKHPAFKNKVKTEACYSSTNAIYGSKSACPKGKPSSTAKNSAKYCKLSVSGCDHGTHVAGIAVGNPKGKYKGVAKGAYLFPVQVFSEFPAGANCGASPCALTFTSDQILGLERVYKQRKKYKIASVNMSLGGSTIYSSACDSDSRKPIIDNLRKAKIATVIASGNSGSNSGVGAPGCISSAITVGSTDKNDGISSFSNHHKLVDLMAPGGSIMAPVPKTGYGVKSGTSMATPHVAGTWAVLRQGYPKASVTQIEKKLECTGVKVKRSGVKKPRIDVFGAYNALKNGC